MARVVASGKPTAVSTNKSQLANKSAQSSGAQSGASKNAIGSKKSSTPRIKDKAKLKLTAGDVKLDLDPQTVGLTLKRIAPLSAAKVGFFLSIALGIVMVVAVSVFCLLLDTSGIIFQFSQSLVSSGLGTDVTSVFSVGKVAIIASLLACANVVLMTLFSLLFAAIYNAAARLGGGLKLYFSKH